MNDTISQLVLSAGPGVIDRASESPARQPVKVEATTQVRLDSPSGPGQRSAATSQGDLTESIKQVNSTLESAGRGLRFSVDDDSGRIVVKVIDLGTDEVVRQIPSEEALSLIKQMGSNGGLIINAEA